jgi:hypothetical protein
MVPDRGRVARRSGIAGTSSRAATTRATSRLPAKAARTQDSGPTSRVSGALEALGALEARVAPRACPSSSGRGDWAGRLRPPGAVAAPRAHPPACRAAVREPLRPALVGGQPMVPEPARVRAPRAAAPPSQPGTWAGCKTARSRPGSPWASRAPGAFRTTHTPVNAARFGSRSADRRSSAHTIPSNELGERGHLLGFRAARSTASRTEPRRNCSVRLPALPRPPSLSNRERMA